MDGHASQVNVVQELVVELDGHAGGEEHHHLLVPVLLQEGEEEEEALVTGTDHIPGERILNDTDLNWLAHSPLF